MIVFTDLVKRKYPGRLSAEWTIEIQELLEPVYGLDAETEIEKMLIDYINQGLE
jgi:hypothetical protein